MEYFDRGVLHSDVLERVEQKIHREVYKRSKSKPKLSELQKIITQKVSIQSLIPIYISSLRKKQTNFTKFLKEDAIRRADAIKSVLIAKKEVNRMIQYAKKQIRTLSTRNASLEKRFGSLKTVSSRSLQLSKKITSLRRLLKNPKLLNKVLMNEQTKLINTRKKDIEDCERNRKKLQRKLNDIDDDLKDVLLKIADITIINAGSTTDTDLRETKRMIGVNNETNKRFNAKTDIVNEYIAIYKRLEAKLSLIMSKIGEEKYVRKKLNEISSKWFDLKRCHAETDEIRNLINTQQNTLHSLKMELIQIQKSPRSEKEAHQKFGKHYRDI